VRCEGRVLLQISSSFSEYNPFLLIHLSFLQLRNLYGIQIHSNHWKFLV
jgi:hypothetical protein